MASKLYTVNMGEGRPSLSTVGYAIKNADKSVYQTRTTAGVTEIGTATGIYGVTLNLPLTFVGTIEWDSGESNPVYAAEDISPSAEDKSGLVIDDVRTLLRAHLNQLVDFINMKFKEIPEPEGGVKELTEEVKDLKTRLFSHLEEDEKTDTEWEDNYLTPILEKVNEINADICQKHEQIINAYGASMKEISVAPVVAKIDEQLGEKLENVSRQVTELQKDVASIGGDVERWTDSMKSDIRSVIDGVRQEVSGVPSKISIPNYEERLKKLEQKLGEGINFILNAGEKEFEQARKEIGGSISELQGAVKELDSSVSLGAEGINRSFSKRLGESVTALLEMLNELHPDTLEKRRLDKEKKQNGLNFIMGVKR